MVMDGSAATRISVVIISHGHEPLLEDCLKSLVSGLEDINSQIILLDNLPDGNVSLLLQPLFPSATFIRNSQPKGFADNANRATASSNGEYLLFLNPDTRYKRGSIAAAMRYLDRHPEIAVLGCRMFNLDGSLQRNYRRFPTLPVILARGFGADRWPWRPGYYRWRMMEDELIDRPAIVDWVFGAFLLVRRTRFLGAGGMDPSFRLYYEDVDLCYRFRRQGLGTAVFPGLEFIHHHMRSSARRPFGTIWRWHFLSAWRFLRKHRYWLRPGV